jgi:ribonuclease P protein subunit POP4
MMIDKNNILIHEFIGLEVEIAKSTCKNLIGKRGRVVNETKNTIEIEGKDETKIIPKRSSTFRFYLPGGESADVEGRLIEYNPEDRPKRLMKYVRKVG